MNLNHEPPPQTEAENFAQRVARLAKAYEPGPPRHATLAEAVAAVKASWGNEVERTLFHDPDGQCVAASVRSTTGRRRVASVHLNGDEWQEGTPPGLHPLYGLPSLKRSEASPVVVAPNAAVADRIQAAGYAAVAIHNGYARASRSELGSLRDRTVVVWLDPGSPPGVHWRLLTRLHRIGASSVSRAASLGTVHEQDSAWLRDPARLTDEQIRLAIDGASEVPATTTVLSACLVPLNEVEAKDVEWLWPGRIALGRITVLAGDPGRGKSLMSLDLAARMTRGDLWPDGVRSTTGPADVLLVNVEDGLEDTIVPRLSAAEADLSRAHYVRLRVPGSDVERPLSLPGDLDQLRALLEEHPGVRLLVIDPITAYASVNWNHDVEVRTVYSGLAQIAEDFGVAILIVAHLNKNADVRSSYRVGGSIAVIAAARAAFCVVPDRDDPERRLMLPVKNNIGNDKEGFAFRIVPSDQNPKQRRIEWEPGVVTDCVDDHLSPPQADHETKLNEAKDWLREQLEGGPILALTIKSSAKAEGISQRTLQRAKAALRVGSFGHHAQSRWQLPATPAAPKAEPAASATGVDRQPRQPRQARQADPTAEQLASQTSDDRPGPAGGTA